MIPMCVRRSVTWAPNRIAYVEGNETIAAATEYALVIMFCLIAAKARREESENSHCHDP